MILFNIILGIQVLLYFILGTALYFPGKLFEINSKYLFHLTNKDGDLTTALTPPRRPEQFLITNNPTTTPETTTPTTTTPTTTTPTTTTPTTTTPTTTTPTTTTPTTTTPTTTTPTTTTPTTTTPTTTPTTTTPTTTTPTTTTPTTTTPTTTTPTTTTPTTTTPTTTTQAPLTICTTSGCGVCTSITSSGGVISSPNYPADYGNRRACIYNIQVPVGKRIRLTFTTFVVERNSDWIDVYSFNNPTVSNSYNQDSSLTGYQLPDPITSTSNVMTVHFKSNSNNNNVPNSRVASWRATYTIV